MKKEFIIILLLGISFTVNAQSIADWQIGLNINPFIFNRINSNYKPEKASQDFPNGFGFGLTIEKNWNEHWGIKTGLEYTNQNLKYDNYWFTGNVYSSIMKSEFKYYKLPITVQYYYQIKENLFFIFNQGIQFSFLDDYKTTIDDELQTIIITPKNFNNYDKNSNTNHIFPNNFTLYKNNTFGLIGSVGLKGFISKKISYSTNLRYEYDITTSESTDAFFSDNHNTKNFRIGLELGLQYHFSLGGCDFCKNQKH